MAKAKNQQEEQPLFPSNKVELPCGFFLKYEGEMNCLKEVSIKEMTGRIYTELGSKKIRSNPALFNSTILEQCVENIGGIPLRPKHYEHILSADQNYLVMKIRQLSKGDIVQGETTCISCDERLQSDINLNDLNVIGLPEATEEDLEKGYRVFDYYDDQIDLKATFRYPMILDVNAVGNLAKDNPVEAHNNIMQNCLQYMEFRGQSFEKPFKKRHIESLPISAYESLRDGFLELQPGVEMKVRINCYACGNANELEINTADFLASAPKKQTHNGQTP